MLHKEIVKMALEIYDFIFFLVHCILGFKIKQRKIMPIKLNIDVYFYSLKDTYIFKLGFLFNRVILQELGL